MNNTYANSIQTLIPKHIAMAVIAVCAWFACVQDSSAQLLNQRSSGWKLAQGDFVTVTDVYTYLESYGPIDIYREDLVFTYTGDLQGTATDVNYIFHNTLDDSFESFAYEVTQGTLGGKNGTFYANYYLTGENFSDFNLITYTGYLTITGGTGGFSNLRGFGTFGYDGVAATYSYNYKFGR